MRFWRHEILSDEKQSSVQAQSLSGCVHDTLRGWGWLCHLLTMGNLHPNHVYSYNVCVIYGYITSISVDFGLHDYTLRQKLSIIKVNVEKVNSVCPR